MINSLLKDSHITHSLCIPKFKYSGSSSGEGASLNKRKEYSSATVNNNIGTSVNKPANVSFSGFLNAEKLSSSNMFKKFLIMAADSQAVFNAFFAIGLTCILRPASIMALPTDKKNKDDKKYAAAHSIASGVIGYLISLAIFKPISDAVLKVKENPAKYITKLGTKFNKNNKPIMDAASTYLNMLPEAIFAPPRAVVTIALIPIILKHVFGWEKKKKEEPKKEIPLTENHSALNFKSLNSNDKKVFQSFSGGLR